MEYQHEYGSSAKGAKRLSQIVFDLIAQGKRQTLLFKGDVVMDASLHDAVKNACIQLGLNSGPFAPSINDMGNEIEICLY